MNIMIKELNRKIKEYQSGIEYCDNALKSNLEKWERKEYQQVKDDYQYKLSSSLKTKELANKGVL